MNFRFRTQRFQEPEGDGSGGSQGGAPAPSPAPAPGPAPAPAPAPPGLAWLPGADEATVGYVQNKAWTGPGDVLTGYRNLETMLGADRAGRTVVLPADENDAPAWAKVHERLGRPANAADYKLPVPEGADPAFATAAAAKFHELGIPLKQAQALTAWWNETAGGVNTAAQAAESAAIAADVATLQKDWGAQVDARTEVARRGAVAMGLDATAIDALQKVAGYAGVMKALAKVGDLTREGGAAGLKDIGGFGMTPEGAKARRTELLADADFRAKAMQPNSSQWGEMKRLDEIIASTKS